MRAHMLRTKRCSFVRHGLLLGGGGSVRKDRLRGVRGSLGEGGCGEQCDRGKQWKSPGFAGLVVAKRRSARPQPRGGKSCQRLAMARLGHAAAVIPHPFRPSYEVIKFVARLS